MMKEKFNRPGTLCIPLDLTYHLVYFFYALRDLTEIDNFVQMNDPCMIFDTNA